MKEYEINTRVEYYIMRGKQRIHRVGFIKRRFWTLTGPKYAIAVADRSRELDFVKPGHIFGPIEKRAFKSNKTSNNEI